MQLAQPTRHVHVSSCSSSRSRRVRRQPDAATAARARRCPSCVPNRDGQITADELPIALGATLVLLSPVTSGPSIWSATDGMPGTSRPSVPTTRSSRSGRSRSARSGTRRRSRPASSWSTPATGSTASIIRTTSALWLDGTASHEAMPARGQDADRLRRAGRGAALPARRRRGVHRRPRPLDRRDDRRPAVRRHRRVRRRRHRRAAQLDVAVRRLLAGAARAHAPRRARPSAGTPTVGSARRTSCFECFGEVARAESKPDETDRRLHDRCRAAAIRARR